ncbi:hypothetical protein EON80_24240 [bacterium]|nr:MAG: hypothetical protein EON80_24240 [bacterium]
MGEGSLLMEGIGELITPMPVLDGWMVIVKPEASFPTPAIYRAWDGGGFESVRGSTTMKDAVEAQDLRAVAQELTNDLERAAGVISEIPGQLIELLKQSGAMGAQMSGSGSACFGIFENEAAAQDASLQLRAELAKDVHLRNSQLFVAPFCPRGVEVAP